MSAFLAKLSHIATAINVLQWPQLDHCSYFFRKFSPSILAIILPLLYKNRPFSTRHRQETTYIVNRVTS